MKKITLLLFIVLYGLIGHAQYPENFEDPSVTAPNGFPFGWLVTDNGIGTNTNWEITDNTTVVLNGTKSAIINCEQIGEGNTSEDWLISPAILIPTNSVLRFFTRQTLPGDNGTIYQVRISSGISQSDLNSYTLLEEWTESEMNQIYNQAEEKVVNLPNFPLGVSLHIAFVRIYTQPSAAIGGDRWIIDNINIVENCLSPTNIDALNITATTAQFTWDASPEATGYELEIIPSNEQSTGIATDISETNTYFKSLLTPDTCYKFYVRVNCGDGNFSEWVGPLNFCTLPFGANCSDPIIITSLPYQSINNTASFGNLLAGPQQSGCISGGTNYQAGNDVFYSYTATEDCNVSFTLNATQVGSSMFIYPNCAGITGPCLAAVGNNTNQTRVIDYAVTAGTTYTIVVSSSSQSPTVDYDLVIQCNNCPEKPINLGASNILLTSADLFWTPPIGGEVLSYEIVVQPQGSLVPSGPGEYTTTVPNLTITDLQPNNYYQYWVRSECAPGVFSAWAGPMVFIEETCFKPTNLMVSGITTISANLTWTEAASASQWEVLLLNASNGIAPATPGFNPIVGPSDFYQQNITGATTIITSILQPATIYYYYVRAVCEPGEDQSSWAGPFIFNTDTCNAEEKCSYKFFLTNEGANTWNDGRMQVRQNGVVVSQLGTGGVNNPNGIVVQICNDLPFDLFWSQEGNEPEQVGIKIENAFGDVVYTKLPGEGTPMTVLYQDLTLENCLPPTCPKPNYLYVIEQTPTTVTLSWNETGSATQWEIYVSAFGAPAPIDGAPLNGNVSPYFLANTNTNFVITGLLPNTDYEFYVRAICSTTDFSTWKKSGTDPGNYFLLHAFIDTNNNGIKDIGETIFPYGSFTYVKNNIDPLYYLSSSSGYFNFHNTNSLNSFDFDYIINPEYAAYYNVSPTNFNDIIQSGGTTQALYFPITSTQPYNEVQVSIIPLGTPQPGFEYTHKIVYRNTGSSTTSGTITYIKSNPNVTITSISASPTVPLTNGFTYEYTNLLPNETRYLHVNMLTATIPTINLGDVITSTVTITPELNDINIANNSFTTAQTVIGSYDPNDKTEARGENVEIGQFSQNDYLFYTIRFQNSGTANAQTVRIEDTLESEFDFTSIRMISASHEYTMQRVGNKVVWTFSNIDLPYESQNEPESHGYVTFKIKLNPGFTVGDVIENTAKIYFDFNPAIVTNTFQTTFVPNLKVGSFDVNDLVIYPNPAKEIVQVQLKSSGETLKEIVIYDIIGKVIKTISGNGTQQTSINVGDLSQGVYMIEITTENNLRQTKKLVVN